MTTEYANLPDDDDFETIPCPACGGLEDPYGSRDPICYLCNGTGEVTTEQDDKFWEENDYDTINLYKHYNR